MEAAAAVDVWLIRSRIRRSDDPDTWRDQGKYLSESVDSSNLKATSLLQTIMSSLFSALVVWWNAVVAFFLELPVRTFLGQSFPPKPLWSTNDIPDLTGRVIIVTGVSALQASSSVS